MWADWCSCHRLRRLTVLVKRLLFTLAAVALFAAGCSSGGPGAPSAATVNGTDVTMSSFLDDLDALASSAAIRTSFEEGGTSIYGPDDRSYTTAFTAGWLTQRIQDLLVEQQLEEVGGTPTAEETSQAQQQLSQVAGELPAELVERLTNSAANQAALQRVLDEQAASQSVTDDEVRAFYDENIEAQMQQVGEVACGSFGSIAFDPAGQSATGTPEQVEAAQQTAQQIADRVASGEDLVSAANSFSQNTTNAVQGGDLSCFAQSGGQLPPEVVDAAFTLPVGQLSEPIETSGGLVLILVRSRGVLPFEEAEASIRQQLGQERGATAKEQFVRDADITVDPRFGTFDTATAAVVPPEGPTAPSTDLPLVDQLEGTPPPEDQPAATGTP